MKILNEMLTGALDFYGFVLSTIIPTDFEVLGALIAAFGPIFIAYYIVFRYLCK